jgi:hypothetical protein
MIFSFFQICNVKGTKLKSHFYFISLLLLVLTFFGLYSKAEAQIKPISRILITIRRDAGLGGFVYSAQIYADGTVDYLGGAQWLQVKGKRRYKISIDKIKELVEEFQKINYFSLKDRYDAAIADAGITTTSFSLDGKQKSVTNRWDAPKELYELENKIEEIAGLHKYIDNLKMRLDNFYTALNAAPTAKGFIINYGTAKKVAKRVTDIKGFMKFNRDDPTRVKFFKRIRNSETKTEFQIIDSAGKITKF